MDFIQDDGGRSAAGFKGSASDCVTRAIAIATERPYREVYDALNALAATEKVRTGHSHSSARTGIWRETYQAYLASVGWRWTPTMLIGQGCRVHLRAAELPKGRIICRLSKHMVAVIDGVIRDTSDPQRHGLICEDSVQRPMGDRCVYGYFSKA